MPEKSDERRPGSYTLSDDHQIELQKRLELLQKKQEIVTNKEARAEIRYEIAELQWQLGLITDEEFREIEEFYQSFTYEWC